MKTVTRKPIQKIEFTALAVSLALSLVATVGVTQARSGLEPVAVDASSNHLVPVLAPAKSASIDEATIDVTRIEQATLASLQDISRHPAGRAVELEIVDLRATPDSLAALNVDGVGRMRVAQGEWIPLRFSAGYDLVENAVFEARIEPIAGASRRDPTTIVEPTVREQVNGQVAGQILREFADQPVDLSFGPLEAISDSETHLAVRGTGQADFAAQGKAPVQFTAILDRASGLVMSVSYSMDDVSLSGSEAMSAAIASAP
jgi:hypothetical protein